MISITTTQTTAKSIKTLETKLFCGLQPFLGVFFANCTTTTTTTTTTLIYFIKTLSIKYLVIKGCSGCSWLPYKTNKSEKLFLDKYRKT